MSSSRFRTRDWNDEINDGGGREGKGRRRRPVPFDDLGHEDVEDVSRKRQGRARQRRRPEPDEPDFEGESYPPDGQERTE